MRHFIMNGILWKVRFVDPSSHYLIDRTKTYRLATTDPKTKYIYLSSSLKGDMIVQVLLHELAHAAIFSFGLLQDIHRAVPPPMWIEAEEWVCNFIADYGRKIFQSAYAILGDDAWLYVPYNLEKLVG